MRSRRFLALVLLASACSGCQPVLVQHPLGTPVNEDLSKTFDGVWETHDGRFVFFVKSNPHGLLDVAGIEWREGKFVLRDTSCIVTRLGDWSYLNVPLPPDSLGRQFYLFAPFVANTDGSMITAFVPSYKFFIQAIGNKDLLGVSKGQLLNHIEIDDPKQKFFETQADAIMRSSQAIILKRTRKGLISVAWPMEK